MAGTSTTGNVMTPAPASVTIRTNLDAGACASELVTTNLLNFVFVDQRSDYHSGHQHADAQPQWPDRHPRIRRCATNVQVCRYQLHRYAEQNEPARRRLMPSFWTQDKAQSRAKGRDHRQTADQCPAHKLRPPARLPRPQMTVTNQNTDMTAASIPKMPAIDAAIEAGPICSP